MQDDIRKSDKGGNTAYLNIGAWYDEKTGEIHLGARSKGSWRARPRSH